MMVQKQLALGPASVNHIGYDAKLGCQQPLKTILSQFNHVLFCSQTFFPHVFFSLNHSSWAYHQCWPMVHIETKRAKKTTFKAPFSYGSAVMTLQPLDLFCSFLMMVNHSLQLSGRWSFHHALLAIRIWMPLFSGCWLLGISILTLASYPSSWQFTPQGCIKIPQLPEFDATLVFYQYLKKKFESLR